MDAPPRVIVLTNCPYSVLRKRCLDLGAEFFLDKATELEKIKGILTGPQREGE